MVPNKLKTYLFVVFFLNQKAFTTHFLEVNCAVMLCYYWYKMKV